MSLGLIEVGVWFGSLSWRRVGYWSKWGQLERIYFFEQLYLGIRIWDLWLNKSWWCIFEWLVNLNFEDDLSERNYVRKMLLASFAFKLFYAQCKSMKLILGGTFKQACTYNMKLYTKDMLTRLICNSYN